MSGPLCSPASYHKPKKTAKVIEVEIYGFFPPVASPEAAQAACPARGREPGAKATARQLQGSTPSVQEALHSTHMSRAEQSRAASSYRSVGRGQLQGQARKPT